MTQTLTRPAPTAADLEAGFLVDDRNTVVDFPDGDLPEELWAAILAEGPAPERFPKVDYTAETVPQPADDHSYVQLPEGARFHPAYQGLFDEPEAQAGL